MKLDRYLLAILLLVVTCLVPVMTYANSAEPPSLVIIMNNAPDKTFHTSLHQYHSMCHRERSAAIFS